MFGYTIEEFVRLNFLDLAADSDMPMVLQTIARRLSGAEVAGHSSFRCRRKDGSEIIVDVHGTRLDDHGEPALTGIVLDVTEAKRTAERQLQHVEQLERMLQHTIGAITTMGDIRDSSRRDQQQGGHEV